ncbi:hypothetical protein J2Z31_005749 [Sinorhizobium kostiense]|uniref:Uncharacterized protein n=1 Tax=Sinorhizobium kostiense TaxID=76747 RepID=A0ABS4R8J6_9HYPH|nr:hypothetical protein [Sinorhizobium kostiense]
MPPVRHSFLPRRVLREDCLKGSVAAAMVAREGDNHPAETPDDSHSKSTNQKGETDATNEIKSR